MFVRSFATALSLSLCVGCASGPPPRVVRAADLSRIEPLVPGQPVIIAFEAGDEIPLHVAVDGPLVQSPRDAPPIRLRVLRKFFVRIDEDGMKSSLDGKQFGDSVAPGAFSVGFGATRQGARANISIRTPTLREPAR